MASNTIVLRGSLGVRHEEYRVSVAFKPGHLLELLSTGKVRKLSVLGGKTQMVAKEDALQGRTVNDAYAADELALVHQASLTDRLQLRLPAAAPAVVIGDRLISDGAGCVIKATAAGQNLYTSVAASAAVENTVTETAFDKTYTFPANTLKVGDIIRIRGQAIATSTNSTDTLTVRVKIGSTTIVATAALDVANNDVVVFDVSLVIRTIGASGTLVGYGTVTIGPPASATMKPFALASTTVDTTATQLISVTAQWSVAHASNSVRLDNLNISEETAVGNSAGETIGYATEAVDNSAGVDEAFIAVNMAA